MLERKRDAYVNARNRDPFDALPAETVCMILDYFYFRELVCVCYALIRPHCLANFSIHCRLILRVSKGWKRCLTSLQQPWMRIELEKRRPDAEISGHAVQKYIRWSRNKLRHIVVKDLSVDAAHQTLAMLSKCSELEHLEFWGDFDCSDFYKLFENLKKLKTLITSSQVSQEYIAKFFEALPLLERVEFLRTTNSLSVAVQWPNDLPNLKRLSLDCHDEWVRSLGRVPGLHLPVSFVNDSLVIDAGRPNYV